MGWFLLIFSALLLSGFCRGGPATLTPDSGICWVMGTLHDTFDGNYYSFMGNCTYTMAKNCHVDQTFPAFDVAAKYVGTEAPTVGAVTVNVYGINIDIVQSELGMVQVNYQRWTLPINLNNGQVKLFQRGQYVIVETDFGLTVKYDWNQYLAITVPSSYAGKMCGLCGNFNNKKEDDLTTPSGSIAGSAAALGKSWRVLGAAGDAFCHDGCVGQCENCPLSEVSEVQKLEKQIFCSALTKNFPELLGCQPQIDVEVFQSSCMLSLCTGETVETYLSNTLQGFADICQRSGVKVPDWRTPTKSPIPKCPKNSHYEFCGSGCPATCANPNTPTNCEASCVESCVCDDGLILSGTQCVPKAQCGCLYEGYYVQAGATFWGDNSCTKQCTCSAGGSLSCKETTVPVGQQCQVVDGIRGLHPVNEATCMVSGDPHFVTFDGERYNFQGTCAYLMAGVSSSQTSLEHFSVILQNNGQNKKIGSVVKQIEVEVYGYNIVISKEYPGAVVVNGELSNLPLTLDSTKLKLYRSGWFAVIETDFGVKVYYDWSNIVFVIIPSTYKGAMQGLCGNYNLNPKDDMQMKNGKEATTSEELGQSWKVGTLPGCVDGCSGTCPGCNATQKATYNTNRYCGLITDPAGPFRDCHSKVNPVGFLNDCLYDVCLYQGSRNMQCNTLTAYTAACQLKGATVYSWRSAQFCDVQYPSNSQYELCTSECYRTCQKDAELSDCAVQCMEGYVCDEGYLLSGNECVPADQCGCISDGKYYQQGQVFFPDTLCQEECTCNSTVQCKPSSCGPYEKCETKNFVRSCQPLGKGICSISGDPHYNTFDNATYDFQGTCTYVVAEGCHLSGTRLNSFSVVVENERWYRMTADSKVSVAKLVAVEVYNSVLILRRNEVGMVWMNGVLYHLPVNLGTVKVYQEGANDVITTDFGLRVTYDLVYHVTVTVPGNYHGRTCGLCGNFNDDKTDEYQLPNGNLTKDFGTFGAAWKVPVPGVVCEDGCSGDLCPKCDDSEKAVFEEKCAIINNPKGPFAACHDVIDPASYFRDCVYDTCMAKQDQSILCHSIAAYMLDCQQFGAKIQNWRSPSFCPFTCSANSHYETCMQPCASPCPGLSETVTCFETCVEGCACDKDYYYNGTGCVPFDQCSCYYNGQTYKVGESIITDDCHRIHTCQASGIVLSTNMSCDPNENCLVKNGVMGCYVQQCILEGNGTLTAFNGDSGSVKLPGAYEIIQSCDQSQASDWFRVVVKFETCSPGVNTIVAVHVFFNDAVITINSTHGIWVNGRLMTQSTFSKGSVKLMVSDKTVRISSPATLQLSFSSTNELTMSVSDKVADMVCGACGKLKPVSTTTGGLSKRLPGTFHGQSSTYASLNIGQWTAPDFPSCVQ